jgi:hypothetical protein
MQVQNNNLRIRTTEFLKKRVQLRLSAEQSNTAVSNVKDFIL